MLQIRYVWEWPVRITHWVNVISMVVLAVTGFYIGNPFVSVPSSNQFVMGYMRFIHYCFAYAFTISILVRIIWSFVGNHHASWKEFFPWVTASGWKRIIGTFNYYSFLAKKPPYEIGHNALAAMAYSVVYLLYIVQIVSGFALWGQFAPGGTIDSLFGPLLATFGNQGLRMTHHIIMWLLIGFGIHHVYSAWLMDVKEKNGTLSSIFGGYKFIEPEDL